MKYVLLWSDALVYLFDLYPTLCDLGSKSGSREIFREAGVPMADGRERLRDANDAAEALASLGFKKAEVEDALAELRKERVDGDVSTLVKEALRRMSR